MSDFYPNGQGYGYVTAAPLPAPVLRFVSASGLFITLAWTQVPKALGYGVFDDVGNLILAMPPTVTQLAGLDVNTGYTVRALGLSGYGLPSNEVVAVGAYYGFVADAAPTPTEIQLMAFLVTDTVAGDYSLTQDGAAARYPCFAFPATLGIPSEFEFSTSTVGMQQSQTFIGTQLYNVFVSPYATFGTSLDFTVVA